MDSLILLGLVIVLSGPVGLVVGILAFRRSGRLEKRLQELEQVGKPLSVSRPEKSEVRAAQEPKPEPKIAKPQVKKTLSGLPKMDLEAVLGGQWLTWAGILALFFGTAFFLGVDLGASPLTGLPQVLIGLVTALVFMFVGHRLCSRAERFLGLGLLGGGLALLYLAMFAAYGFHHLVPLVVVLPLLMAVATIGALLALRRDSLTIASLNLVGAILTPLILVNLAGDNAAFDALLPYLVAVNLGAVLVGLRRGWAGLPLGAFLATLVLIVVWWDQHPRTDLYALFSVMGSWLVYAAAPWLQREGNRFWSFARAAVLAANGLFFALFCYHWLDGGGRFVQGSALVVLAIIYFLTSRLMKVRRGESPVTRLSHSTGTALAVLAVPVLLSMAWVTVGWTLLAGILIMAGLRERDLWQRLSGLVIMAIGLFRVVFWDVPGRVKLGSDYHPLFNGEFLAGLAALILVGWTFWAYHRYEDRLHPREKSWRSSLLVLGTSIMLWKLSYEIVGYFEWRRIFHSHQVESEVWLWILALWSVYGLAMLLIGLRTNYLPLRRPGYLVLAVALAGTVLVSISEGLGLVQNYLPVVNLPFMQGLLLTVALAALAWRLSSFKPDRATFETRLTTPLIIAAVLVLFMKVSLEVLAFFKFGSMAAAGNMAVRSQLGLSVVWGLYSGIVIGIGFARRFKTARLLGMSLLGLTVLKVFILDMGVLDRGYRIAAFVVLGVLLLGISVLYQRERRSRGDASD